MIRTWFEALLQPTISGKSRPNHFQVDHNILLRSTCDWPVGTTSHHVPAHHRVLVMHQLPRITTLTRCNENLEHMITAYSCWLNLWFSCQVFSVRAKSVCPWVGKSILQVRKGYVWLSTKFQKHPCVAKASGRCPTLREDKGNMPCVFKFRACFSSRRLVIM